MTPVVALVGRPNVGKSTLFNRLTHSRDALVADFPGLTRDRKYGQALFADEHKFIVIDTGGIDGSEEGIEVKMAEQSLLAIEEADIVLFLVDARAGVTSADIGIADHLRRQQKKVYLVANKTDGIDGDSHSAEFYSLALGEVYQIAAAHGRGVTSLMEMVLGPIFAADATDGEDPHADDEEVRAFEEEWFGISHAPANVDDEDDEFAEEDEEADEHYDPHAHNEEKYADLPIKFAIIGRPNVGKSTLTNRMLGEDRVIVYDMPGTTRDSVYIPLERDEQRYIVIDTAGVRKRKKIYETVEKFSVVKTLQAIEDANVVLLLIDAREGISDQDLSLLGFTLNSGRSIVIAVNKWDGLDQYTKDQIKESLEMRLGFVDFARVHFISALHGSGVGNLFDSILEAYQSATKRISTSMLTRIMNMAQEDHQPPLVRGRRVKLKYAHAGGYNPPRIIVHGNQVEDLPDSYKRYLINYYRKSLKIMGTPIHIEFQEGDNPFEGRRNKLTQSQMRKRRRMMKFVKKG